MGFSNWSPWSQCSATCEGIQTRSRECRDTCSGKATETESCGTTHCPGIIICEKYSYRISKYNDEKTYLSKERYVHKIDDSILKQICETPILF